MTPDKQKQKLAGQTAIAQKVFQAVPIAEAWTVAQISQALHRTTGARLDRHTLQGCLRALADEVDAAALALEEEQSRTTGEAAKLKQLKALLKEIA